MEFEKARPQMAKELLKEQKEQERLEAERIAKEILQREKALNKLSIKNELTLKRQNKLAKILGEDKPPVKQGKSSKTTVATLKGPKSFTDKMDQWLDRLSKRVEDQEVLERAKVHDYLEGQKEVKETLKLFEESLKYHKENHEYKKKMSEAVRVMEVAERQLAKTTSKAAGPMSKGFKTILEEPQNEDLRDMLNENSIGDDNDGPSRIITKPVYDQDEAFNFVGGTKLPPR
jgi:hypothetical protein